MFRGKDRAQDAPKPGVVKQGGAKQSGAKQGGIARIVAAATPGRGGEKSSKSEPKPKSKSKSKLGASSKTASPVPAASAASAASAALAKGKLAYEARRAEKAGMGLEKWMAEKERRVQAERAAIQRAKRKMEPGRQADAAKPGLLRRLLDRAHRPL